MLFFIGVLCCLCTQMCSKAAAAVWTPCFGLVLHVRVSAEDDVRWMCMLDTHSPKVLCEGTAVTHGLVLLDLGANSQ